jgi:hypothetical protein
VQLAARLCDQAGADGILVSAAVRDLCIGKNFGFMEHGELNLRGFDEPVRAYTVHWNDLLGASPSATYLQHDSRPSLSEVRSASPPSGRARKRVAS